ncbi:MAG TPA: response regulator [Nitrospirota bacterium]|nr:response regulator [Nitrospirota bacterium]
MTESRRDIPTGMPERRSRFLLAVDSDVNDLFYLSMLLQRFEYNISTATNAAEALKMAGIVAPSLVITSLVLSDMSGLELIKRMRQDPRLAAVPVLIKTRDRTPETERLCRQAGVAACLYEPVNAEELYRAVQAAIEPTPRQNIRIHTMLSVIVNGKPLECVEGECASVLSEHGMYVRTLRPHPPNTRLPVQIVIKGRSVPVEAVVLYSHKFGEGPFKEPGMGLKFVRVTPKDQELIRLFIREELMKGIPG